MEKQKEEKKRKKRVQTYPKAAWTLVQALSLLRMKSRAQVTSTRNTITHDTVTDTSDDEYLPHLTKRIDYLEKSRHNDDPRFTSPDCERLLDVNSPALPRHRWLC
ncbi:hypothetical protein J6590_010674 [Homalodisca vitripennis]|nr:hypothetical protein J6590_010674 [Homalodisca vitripennis]